MAGGLGVGGVGIVAADKPVNFERDLAGETFEYVPCLGEGLEIQQGTVAVTTDIEQNGDCWHLQFHRHCSERLVVGGPDTGRTWTGQGSKNNTFDVCPPHPGEQTVTNSTTVTSNTAAEDTVVQFGVTAHVMVTAGGDVSVAFDDTGFGCKA